MSKQNTVIFGAGGHGREMVRLIQRMEAAGSQIHAAGFADDNAELHGSVLNGVTVLGDTDWIRGNHEKYAFVCAIGIPKVRKTIVEKLNKIGVKWATLIDPDCNIPEDSIIGEGAMVCAGTRMTTNITIGRHTIVNLGCTLSHDLRLGDYGTLACGVHISGNVSIGEGAELGVGANVIQDITIGEWSIVGAGAAVVRDIPGRVTAVGVPAKVIKEHK